MIRIRTLNSSINFTEGAFSHWDEPLTPEDALENIREAIKVIEPPPLKKERRVLICGSGMSSSKKQLIGSLRRELNSKSLIYDYSIKEIDDMFVPDKDSLFILEPDKVFEEKV